MTNPLLNSSELPYHLPPFAEITIDHYRPAFEQALARHKEEIIQITTSQAAPTWSNTVEALEASGQDLARVSAVFFNLYSTDANEEMNEIAAWVAPLLSEHSDSIYLNQELLARFKAVDIPNDGESQRLYEHWMRQFARHGALLNDDDRKQLSEINARLSVLADEFGRNLLAETRELAVIFVAKDELAGLSAERIASAAKDAEQHGQSGFVLPLGLPSVQDEQASLHSKQSREKLYQASLARGMKSNPEVLLEIVRLRAKKAALLGYKNHAEYVIEEETAESVAAVHDLLYSLSPQAATNARNEHKLLSEAARLAADTSGEQIGDQETLVGAADWPYWEAQVRARDFHLDEDELSAYFPLRQALVDGVFFAAARLYGISISARKDLSGYADDVEVWEVKDADGSGLGLFITDYYARPSKRGGAWMSEFVSQSQLLATKPVVVNVMGITKPADGSDALLSIDQLRTLFHEFGHGLHGLLSQVRYPSFSGTNVPRDYVEFPSQINENWAFEPTVLKNYARHVVTGEVIPDRLVSAMNKARQFGQGFATSEYLAAAIIDLAWHTVSVEEADLLTPADIESFEHKALEDAGLTVPGIAPRYRSTYFNHIFAGGYSAGYYSYLWAEALDADGFDWFITSKAAGDYADEVSVRRAGERFRQLVLSRGGADDFKTAFENLRGREKDVEPLLKRRGLSGAV
ncbi:M3 family metallopeptidase [Corynebacterium kutscheri]|uniref:M3 family metallopeptidase n=1 Tax=Corynebacterium kutscheri TaxID=35755 RepID=UPI0037BFECC6